MASDLGGDTETMTAAFPPAARPPVADPLAARLSLLRSRVLRAVAERAAADPAPPDDPLRGLYISDDAALRLLDLPTGPLPPDTREEELELQAGTPPRLASLSTAFGLSPHETELLLVALAPDLDPRLERAYAYLNDDVSVRRATSGLALRLCGMAQDGAEGRAALAPDGPLRSGGLLEVEDDGRPYPSRTLRVPDRVTEHLLGRDVPPPALARHLLCTTTVPGRARAPLPDGLSGVAGRLARAVARTGLVYLRDRHGGPGALIAEAALRQVATGVLHVSLPSGPDPVETAALLRVALLEAGLTGSALVVERPGAPDDAPYVVRREMEPLTGPGAPAVPVVLVGHRPWDARWASALPRLLECPALSEKDRIQLWRQELSDARGEEQQDPRVPVSGEGSEAVVAAARYRLSPRQIQAAAESACHRAAAEGGPLDARALTEAARAAAGGALGRFTRRVAPTVSWADLVLPDSAGSKVRDLAHRARHREKVLGRWRMRPGGGRGYGVTALFSGASGTGKTLAAEVVAAELGLELCVVDLAAVVDKYVGETQKHLGAVFHEAETVDAVLLFDEADAVFGKRSAGRDAQDRHANTETAYLLARLEAFDGVAVLTTNLHAHLDPAFLRRFDTVVHFPSPGERQRYALWDRCLGGLPRAADLDLNRLARGFDLSGGAIRCCAVTAAYHVAATGRPVTTQDLLTAVRAEYGKLGRRCVEDPGPTGAGPEPARA
ncbi:ATP-binding protein [Streptomyces cinnamoneus]|uniref:ATP-binding protein n=1 Tax=Streptomyces cinnamoneus TaxID=53446 RepID=UPI0033C5A308